MALTRAERKQATIDIGIFSIFILIVLACYALVFIKQDLTPTPEQEEIMYSEAAQRLNLTGMTEAYLDQKGGQAYLKTAN